MGLNISGIDLKLYNAVDEVIHYLWDPIGISRIPEVRDEYWTYLPAVFKLVKEGQSEVIIADCLSKISTEQMGLSQRQEHDLEIARILLEWKAITLNLDN